MQSCLELTFHGPIYPLQICLELTFHGPIYPLQICLELTFHGPIYPLQICLEAKMLDIVNYAELKCYGANMSNIVTNNPKFLDYLHEGSKQTPIPTRISSPLIVKSLPRIWRSNDGGTYYLNKIENTVWFLGISNAGNFVNIFKGYIDNDVIKGDWADVPLGEDMDYGELELQIKSEDNRTILLKTAEIGGFGASIWMSLGDLSLSKNCEFCKINKRALLYARVNPGLTGIWRSNNNNNIQFISYTKLERLFGD